MRRANALTAATILVALVLLSSGCGSSTATVTGEVTYDGKAIGDGYITFTPADGKGKGAADRIAMATTQSRDCLQDRRSSR
jgi:hypothetical protein